MADVFISYASDDRARVAPLVEYLETRGWSVWWDRSLQPGETWPEVIEAQLNRACCVVVVWSAKSIGSAWVRLEANRARERHNIVPVLLDPIAVPPEFGVFQAFDLSAGGSAELQKLGDGVASQFRRRRRRRLAIASAAVCGLLLVGASASCLLTERCGRSFIAPQVPDTSLAVMATNVDIAGDATRRLLDAFVDDVRSNLRRTDVAKVSSRAETTALPPGMSPIDIGKRLRVRWVVALSVAGSDDRLRILAELIDTSGGYLSDDWRLTGSLGGLAKLNAGLVQDIATHFGVLPAAIAAILDVPSDAYADYLEGRAALREGSNATHLDHAAQSFAAALDIWPDYAQAEAGLCDVELLRYDRSRELSHFEAGERHCNRALAIEPNSGEAAAALGQLYYLQGRYELANQAFQRAAQANETLAEPYMGLGRVAAAEGRTADAEREFRLAVEAEPGYWRTYTALGNFLFQSGRADEAIEQHKRAVALASHDGVALNNLGAARYLSGQLDAAVEAWQATLVVGEQAPTYSNLGAAYYLLGDYGEAVAMYEHSIRLAANDYRTWSNLGDARTMAHDSTAADAYRKATQLIEGELQLNPNDAVTRVGLAAVQAALGDAADATTELARAAATAKSDDWQFHSIAAITEMRLGNRDAAHEHIDAMVKLGYPQILIDLDPLLNEQRVASAP
jgi:tetratricopeptide (TPR) repeat protein